MNFPKVFSWAQFIETIKYAEPLGWRGTFVDITADRSRS